MLSYCNPPFLLCARGCMFDVCGMNHQIYAGKNQMDYKLLALSGNLVGLKS